MKCRKCGTEFGEGFFCPRCGAKIEGDEVVGQIIQGPETKEKRIPWYLSIWFIILISVLSFGFLWIPATVLGMIRFCKYKKRRVGVAFLNIVLLVPCVVVIIVMIIDSKKEGQLNRYIEAGQYLEAQKYIEQEYDEGNYSYTDALAQLYEAQDLYDEAACLWLEYYRENYSLLDIPESAIGKLNRYMGDHGENLREESIVQIQELIADKEQAEAEEQAAKEAKAAEEQAAKEAKAAKEQAAKEAKAAEEQAAKEAKAAEEQVAKEAKAAQKQAKKEVKAQERTEVEDKALKKEEALNDNDEAEESNKSSKKTGHIACEQFNTEAESVLADQIFRDYAEYENINLIELIQDEGSYDRVRAVMSHYDENGLVGIERTCKLSYSGTGHYSRKFEWAEMEEEKLDISGLEGKSALISGNWYYETAVVALFGIYDYLGVEEVSGTMTFHDMDRVKSDTEKQYGMVVNYIYSKKPVVKIEAVIDGKNYEGDFCLGVVKEGPAQTTDYTWREDEGWVLDVCLESDAGDGLVSIEIDLENVK